MFIKRSNPKYLSEELFENAKKDIHNYKHLNDDEFYFNRGSAAISFFVTSYANFLKRSIKVCMQSFTCYSVYEALLHENIDILILDVKLQDFSISLEELKKHKDIDVLLLQHYQGLYNIEYEEICSYCHENNILVVEDLAHFCQYSYKPILSDVAIYSYSLDKPITCMYGGYIKFNYINKDFLSFFKLLYGNLKVESPRKSKLDLKLLEFLYKYSNPDTYIANLNQYDILQILLAVFKEKSVYKMANGLIFNFFILLKKIYLRLAPKKENKINIKRINHIKIDFVKAQESIYNAKKPYYINLQNMIKDRIEKIYDIKINDCDEWNRMSFVRENFKIDDIEASNYNWSSIVVGDKTQKDYPNSSYLSKNIVNFPIWTDKILQTKALNDK